MALAEVNDDNFAREVLEAKGLVLVDFWGTRCAPCKALAPVLEEIAQARTNVRIVKLNADDNPFTPADLSVRSLPTLILFKNGVVADKIIGLESKAKIEAMLDRTL